MQLSRIGVIGAGMMGSEIALIFAMAGYQTLLVDRDRAQVEAALEKLKGLLGKGVDRGLWDEDKLTAAMDNLRAADGLADYADRDLVIEAVFEDEAVKGGIFRELDGVAKQDCVIASNTSSLSITVLSSYLPEARRARFMGIHFFSPVSRMKLVEVIAGLDTDPAVLEAVSSTLRDTGKEPVPVKDVVGFAVNRLLNAFWIEAVRLVEEGAATPEDIDTACRLGLGHPVGPFELMDGITNNLTLEIQEILHAAYGERFLPRPLLKQLVKAGYNGRRHGRGWHRYDADGKRQR